MHFSISHANMLRAVALVAISTSTAFANPISGYLTDPPYTMVAENVLVTVTENAALVTGRYRFRVTPDAAEFWGPPPYSLTFQLPVPVPAEFHDLEEIEAEVHPVITVGGVAHDSLPEMTYFDRGTLPGEAKLPVFYFMIQQTDPQPKIDLVIQYLQPFITVGSREMIYYVPYLPGFSLYEEKLHLRSESFLVAFESVDSTTLHLGRPVTKVVRESPRYIAVRPQHREVIEIEKIAGAIIGPAAAEPSGNSAHPSDN